MISIQTIHIICWKLYVPLHGLHYGRGTKEYHIQMALHMGSIYWIFIHIYPISRLNYFTSFWYNFPNMKYVKKNKCGKEIRSYSSTTIDVFFQISDYVHIVTSNPSINFYPIHFKTLNHVIKLIAHSFSLKL